MSCDGCGAGALTPATATPNQTNQIVPPLRGHAVLLLGVPRARVFLSLQNSERGLARAHAAGHHDAGLLLVRLVPAAAELGPWGGEPL